MAILRQVTLFAALATVYSKVLTGLDDKNLSIDREVSEEEDAVEYNIEHGNGNDGTDMMLSQAQIEWMNGDGSERALAISNWPRTGSNVNIPYTKDENNPWTSRENENILAAIDSYTENTCIRFVPRTTEVDYIHIISGSGCWSQVGMMGGKQELSLKASSCAYQTGTPIHEFMHAIGYLHEQSRSDRDQYVKINFDNVEPGKEHNFNICQGCDLQGLQYDMGSIMHYHQFSFTVDNSIPTIEALDGTSGDLMGQRSGFSPMDIEGINKVYCECAADSDCSGSETCNGGVCGEPVPKVCFDVKTVAKAYGNEIEWTIGCKDSACRGCSSNLNFKANQEYTQECCLPEEQEEFIIKCKDTYGDGWHGGYLEINENLFCDDFDAGDEQQEQMPNEVSDCFAHNATIGRGKGNGAGKVENVPSALECQMHCQMTDECNVFIWYGPELQRNPNVCWMKKAAEGDGITSSFGKRKDIHRVSGPKFCEPLEDAGK